MSGEEQERFEDYLELEHFIDKLQAGRAAHPPKDLTADQAQIYRMAALFRSASPESAAPRSGFADELYARLLAVQNEEQEEETAKRPAIAPQSATVAETVTRREAANSGTQEAAPKEVKAAPNLPSVTRRVVSGKGRTVSRRSLLTASAASAASLVVGVGVGASMRPGDTVQSGPVGSIPAPTRPAYDPYLLLADAPVDLHFVINLVDLGEQVIQFKTETVVGYLLLNNGDDQGVKGEVIALSAACTHMGCIVKWNGSDRLFHCPCHGGMFGEYGQTVQSGPMHYLRSLPQLRTVVADGKVYVEVPKSNPGV